MRPNLRKQSVLKFAGRIIPGAKRRGKTNAVKFEALVELSQERSDAGLDATPRPSVIPDCDRRACDCVYSLNSNCESEKKSLLGYVVILASDFLSIGRNAVRLSSMSSTTKRAH